MTYLPSIPNGTLFDIFLQYPEFSDPLHVFLEQLLRGPSPFSDAEREMIAGYVSGVNECNFCSNVLTGVAAARGAEAGLVGRLLDDATLDAVPDRMRPVLHYVRKLTERPASVGREDVEAILAAGWDERAAVHANLVCGAFNLFNRWVEGLGVDADTNYVKATIRQLLRGNYLGVNEMVAKVSRRQQEPDYRDPA